MKNKIDYQTLLNFSKGKYSYNDYQKVRYWFLNARNDKQIESQLFDQWKELGDAPDQDSLHSIFEKIHYQILLEEKTKKKKLNLWHYYRQVAAILIPIIFFSAAAFFFLRKPVQPKMQHWVEINAPEGARIQFMLPDSSSGWLNSGAKLKYPTVFSSNRQVELTGEAFFKVKHHERSSFTVSVSDMDVKVLGTQFNVSAYKGEDHTSVVLTEGKVEISGKTVKFKQILQPGDKITFNRITNSVDVAKVDPANYSAWTAGYLIIDSETLQQAAKKIERWYNTEIEIQDDMLKSYRFKATFADEPLEEVLQLISMTSPINYEIDKREIDKNGTIKKKHVKITMKP